MFSNKTRALLYWIWKKTNRHMPDSQMTHTDAHKHTHIYTDRVWCSLPTQPSLQGCEGVRKEHRTKQILSLLHASATLMWENGLQMWAESVKSTHINCSHVLHTRGKVNTYLKPALTLPVQFRYSTSFTSKASTVQQTDINEQLLIAQSVLIIGSCCYKLI